ncbi:MAG: lmo0937 family membrane protein [Candidatus Paceibacterota bacterium]
MFGKIIAILLILWLLGFSFKIGGGLIHLLLIFILVALIIRLIS